MPKTNDKDAYFFAHDCNARNDPKILALRSVYGAEGYGVYFMLIEILREQPEYKLSVNKYIWSTLAMQMQMQADRVEQIISDCCTEFTDGTDGKPLLVNDGKHLYSTTLLRRMKRADGVSKVRREAARKRWQDKACKVLEDEDESAAAEASGMAADGTAEEACFANGEQMQNNSYAEQKILHDANENLSLSPQSPAAPLSSPLPLSPTPPLTYPPIIPPSPPDTPLSPPVSGTRARKDGGAKPDPFADFAGDDEELRSALRDFNEMRLKIKKPMTDRAKKLLLTELEKLAPGNRDTQIAILNQSISHCWAGVFALKDGQENWRPRGGTGTADKAAALRDLHEAFAEDG